MAWRSCAYWSTLLVLVLAFDSSTLAAWSRRVPTLGGGERNAVSETATETSSLSVPSHVVTIDSECANVPVGSYCQNVYGDGSGCYVSGCNGILSFNLAYSPSDPIGLFVPPYPYCGWCAASTNFFNDTSDYRVTSVTWLVGRIGSPQGDLQAFIMPAAVTTINHAGNNQSISPSFVPDTSLSVLASSRRITLSSLSSNATFVGFSFDSSSQPVLLKGVQYEAVLSIVDNSTALDAENTVETFGTQGCAAVDPTCPGVAHIAGLLENGPPGCSGGESCWAVRSWEIHQFGVSGTVVPSSVSLAESLSGVGLNALVSGTLSLNSLLPGALSGRVNFTVFDSVTGASVSNQTFGVLVSLDYFGTARFVVEARMSPYAVAAGCRVHLFDGTVMCGFSRTPDVNADGAVDILDAALLASKYGAVERDALYSAMVDLDGDGRVSIVDAAILAFTYNATLYHS